MEFWEFGVQEQMKPWLDDGNAKDNVRQGKWEFSNGTLHLTSPIMWEKRLIKGHT